MVYTPGGMHVECAAIRAMELPPARNAHQRNRVMVYKEQFFIPKECPNPEVPSELKVDFDLRKTQPCRDGNGNLIPRRSKRKKTK